MNAPTCAQLYGEDGDATQGYVLVHTVNDPSWRHGLRVTGTYLRQSDSTYWSAHYRLSTNGETNELAEGLADIYEVEPFKVEVIKFKRKE